MLTETSQSCAPTIEGSLVVGKTVGAGNGCRQGNPTTFSYKWPRCDESGASCTAIAGATKQSYALTADDVGHTLVVLVTAANAAGATGPVNSKPSDVVSAAAPPAFKTPPSVAGKAQVGEALVVKVGTFTGGVPRRFAFQWERCDRSGLNCASVGGATAESYGVRSADVGSTLHVRVTASNDFGSDSGESDATAVVRPIPQPVVVWYLSGFSQQVRVRV